MDAVMTPMAVQGALRAGDTLYYHEWRFHLAGHSGETRIELQLHGLRDFIYAILFATLPWFAWPGICAWPRLGLLGAEIVITLTDFVVERTTPAPLRWVARRDRLQETAVGVSRRRLLGQVASPER
jgi:hypothetical protein